MVRVLVLGGAGEMGKRVVDEVARGGAQVLVGDAREEVARQVAAKHPGASALKADALDPAGRGRREGPGP